MGCGVETHGRNSEMEWIFDGAGREVSTCCLDGGIKKSNIRLSYSEDFDMLTIHERGGELGDAAIEGMNERIFFILGAAFVVFSIHVHGSLRGSGVIIGWR